MGLITGLKRTCGVLAEGVYIGLRDAEREAVREGIAKGERSGQYSRDDAVVSAFREIWNKASSEGRETGSSGILNYCQTSGKYKQVIDYDGAAKAKITLHRAKRPQNRDYEDHFARQNGQWLDENSRAVTLRSGWLKVYAVYNSQCYPAFLRFDRGQSEDLLRLHGKLGLGQGCQLAQP